MKMAKLRVIFPHRCEKGELYLPGDYRLVPAHRVDFYTMPSFEENVQVMVINPDVWKPETASAKYPNADIPAARFEGLPDSGPAAVAGEITSPKDMHLADMATMFPDTATNEDPVDALADQAKDPAPGADVDAPSEEEMASVMGTPKKRKK